MTLALRGVSRWGGLLFGALSGCITSAPETTSELPLEALGWVAEVGQHPESFTALLADGREGWVAVHSHDYPAALEAFTPGSVGHLRARMALAELDADASRLTTFGAVQLFEAWKARGSLPEGPEAPLVAALAASCAGGDPGPWAALVTSGPDKPIAAHLLAGRSPRVEGLPDTPVGRRLALHARVESGESAPEVLVRASTEPLVAEQAGDFTRTFWDPCVASTIAARRIREATSALQALEPSLSDAGLGARLFAAWPTAADVTRAVNPDDPEGWRALGTTSALLDRLGAPAGDDVETAREWLRRLDQALDHWGHRLAEGADADGRALLGDLGLVGRLRQEVVVVQARRALREGRAKQAWALLEQARDSTEDLGPSNSPSLFVLLAESHLRLGRPREAMDALQPLIAVLPYLEGTREILGDWAVLEGLDRRGDSKENP